MPPVNGRRRYDSSRRKAVAEQTRSLVLDVAEQRFLRDGFAGTTVASIAEQAGVSPESIYKSFENKAGIVRAIYERGLTGTGEVAAYQRSDDVRERIDDPRELMRQWGTLTAEVASTVTPILLLIRSAAATDSSMAGLLEASNAHRLERMRHNAEFLADRGFLKKGVSLSEVTDMMWTVSSPELYELLVLERRWTPAQFATFVADTMGAALLP
ncbi:TetR/AcrR family transcriptional regulator [Arthrobacter tumbae]|uniref:TetR/AcrR family transcriptional regulator n=1 Tax=Arthrobacter tumbae TaxID=163874 RepID=UPI00195F02F3|nr:TetR/AcrR family transcriptional regulator [Arthrobacter tumbae]MBM7782222.1 AcrR family transcriptional regulator [Arthrobacter tumbae]